MSRYEMVQCPFDPNHKVCGARYQYHIVRCKAQHPDLDKLQKTCPYNARHRSTIDEYKNHVLNCPDRITLFRQKVTGNPVSEIVNKPRFGIVSQPHDDEYDENDDDWGYNESEANESDANVSFSSAVSSVCSESTIVSREGIKIPFSMGYGRCRGKPLNDLPKSCGRAVPRHRF